MTWVSPHTHKGMIYPGCHPNSLGTDLTHIPDSHLTKIIVKGQGLSYFAVERCGVPAGFRQAFRHHQRLQATLEAARKKVVYYRDEYYERTKKA